MTVLLITLHHRIDTFSLNAHYMRGYHLWTLGGGIVWENIRNVTILMQLSHFQNLHFQESLIEKKARKYQVVRESKSGVR